MRDVAAVREELDAWADKARGDPKNATGFASEVNNVATLRGKWRKPGDDSTTSGANTTLNSGVDMNANGANNKRSYLPISVPKVRRERKASRVLEPADKLAAQKDFIGGWND